RGFRVVDTPKGQVMTASERRAIETLATIFEEHDVAVCDDCGKLRAHTIRRLNIQGSPTLCNPPRATPKTGH
ncbi:MAG TPA: hypothetical protein VMG74_04340, partial [Gaiellaceae bacterium]|nr:hypothetical protein [Gaiellaceae bacterium]